MAGPGTVTDDWFAPGHVPPVQRLQSVASAQALWRLAIEAVAGRMWEGERRRWWMVRVVKGEGGF